MKIYLVGGAVRDQLLGLPVKENDWVVVGATVNDMVKLGYRQVGKDFPVFLHPETKEEYALARMERKIDLGYKGFEFDASPQISLEEDLLRRDLTINAMAKTVEGELIDPYGGKQDLEQRLLRHVSPAFSEDPVRILRVGRFLARYQHLGFRIAPETISLMRNMVTAGEVNALVAERVWKELERALGESHPEAFFAALQDCGALSILFPGLEINGAGMQAFKQAIQQTDNKNVRLAALLHDLPHAKIAINDFAKRFRIPTAYKELALLTANFHEKAIHVDRLTMNALLDFLYQVDVFRREARYKLFLQATKAIAAAKHELFDAEKLMIAATLVKNIPVQPFIAAGFVSQQLAIKLKEERLACLLNWQGEQK